MKTQFTKALLLMLLFFSILFASCSANDNIEELGDNVENVDDNTNPEDNENDDSTDDDSENDDEEDSTATLVGNWTLTNDNSTLIISNYQQDRYRYNHGTNHFYNSWYPTPNHNHYVLLHSSEQNTVTFKYLRAVYAGMRFYNYAHYNINKLTANELILENDRNDVRVYKRN